MLGRAVDGARLLATPHAVSWNQSQLLTVHVADGATAAYNIPMTHWLRCGGADGDASRVSASLVASSVSSVADRHAVLRSTYETLEEGDGFAQRVHPRLSVGGRDGAIGDSVGAITQVASSVVAAEAVAAADRRARDLLALLRSLHLMSDVEESRMLKTAEAVTGSVGSCDVELRDASGAWIGATFEDTTLVEDFPSREPAFPQ